MGPSVRPASERFRFLVLHHEERIVETHVVEVGQLAVDGRNQTGSAIADHSKRGHPVLATGATLSNVVERHLVVDEREPASRRLHHEQSRVVGDAPLLQYGLQRFSFLDVKRLEPAVPEVAESFDVPSGLGRSVRKINGKALASLCRDSSPD